MHIIQHSNNTHFVESCSPYTDVLEEELEIAEFAANDV